MDFSEAVQLYASRLHLRRQLMQYAARLHFSSMLRSYQELQVAFESFDVDALAVFYCNNVGLLNAVSCGAFGTELDYMPHHIRRQVLQLDYIQQLLSAIGYHDSVLQFILENYY